MGSPQATNLVQCKLSIVALPEIRMMRGRKRWYANRCLGILLTPSILGFSTLMEVVASTPTRMGPEFEVDWETFPSTRISLPSKVDGRARASLSTFSWRMDIHGALVITIVA